MRELKKKNKKVLLVWRLLHTFAKFGGLEGYFEFQSDKLTSGSWAKIVLRSCRAQLRDCCTSTARQKF